MILSSLTNCQTQEKKPSFLSNKNKLYVATGVTLCFTCAYTILQAQGPTSSNSPTFPTSSSTPPTAPCGVATVNNTPQHFDKIKAYLKNLYNKFEEGGASFFMLCPDLRQDLLKELACLESLNKKNLSPSDHNLFEALKIAREYLLLCSKSFELLVLSQQNHFIRSEDRGRIEVLKGQLKTYESSFNYFKVFEFIPQSTCLNFIEATKAEAILSIDNRLQAFKDAKDPSLEKLYHEIDKEILALQTHDSNIPIIKKIKTEARFRLRFIYSLKLLELASLLSDDSTLLDQCKSFMKNDSLPQELKDEFQKQVIDKLKNA